MSTETLLKSVLDPLLTGNSHNVINRSDTVALPYVVFQEVEGEPLTGISESYLGKTRCEYEVVVFAATPEHAKYLALNHIYDAITAPPFEGVLTYRATGPYIEEKGNFQYVTQYEIWES